VGCAARVMGQESMDTVALITGLHNIFNGKLALLLFSLCRLFPPPGFSRRFVGGFNWNGGANRGKDMIGLPLRLTYLFLGRKSGCSPFLIQEMVDLIIECLSQSSADLHSCALVSKSWVTKAQSHIFCTVSFSPYKGVEKYERCLMGLQMYPHLSRFIRHIRPWEASPR
jgi:hypothetical protein